MNIYLIIIFAILLVKYFFNLFVEVLNVRNANPVLPREFEGFYDADKYKRSQVYLKEVTAFGIFEDTVFIALTIIFILSGGFNFIDIIARGFDRGQIIAGLIFAGILLLLSQLINLPFSVYHTFVLEEKYGFNKTTVQTFILDLIKGLILGAIIGGTVFAGVLWFFLKTGKWDWVYCWLGVTLFQFFIIFVAPVLILPIFNKFIPLEEGELKKEIENYARSQDFKMQGVFKMDASRRSSKSNAFFTGFGRFRRIALFDTLIEKHAIAELVSILAHEIGHYKKRHIIKNLGISVITAGLMFYILSLFINNEKLFAAFRMEQVSVYASLVFFGFLYTPINMFFSILENIISRKHEFEADIFAVSTYKQAEAFITALKKLSVDNLSNLTPHPLKVFLQDSHAPVLKRIEVLRGSVIEEGLLSETK